MDFLIADIRAVLDFIVVTKVQRLRILRNACRNSGIRGSRGFRLRERNFKAQASSIKV